MIQDHPVAIVIGDCADQAWKFRGRLQRLCVNADRKLDFLKTVLQHRPPDPLLLPYPAFIGLIISVTEAPWRNLTITTLAFGERGGVLLQDTEAVTPMLAVKVAPQDVPGP